MNYQDGWEQVDADTYRLEVPGGWLYRYRIAGICFVPDVDPTLTISRVNALEDIHVAIRALADVVGRTK